MIGKICTFQDSIGPSDFQPHICDQCDQNGRILKILGKYISNKSSPNIW